MVDAALYTYEQVADRIEAVLGRRPALSTLRAAASAERRAPLTTNHRRVTAGMPGPAAANPGRGTLFRADEVEAWLAAHPRRRQDNAVDQLVLALRRGDDEDDAVTIARAAGMSWSAIADAFELTGRRRTRQGLQQRHRRRTGRTPRRPPG